MTWEGLTPPYSTLVVDPPWKYERGGPRTFHGDGKSHGRGLRVPTPPYSMMTTGEIAGLPVTDLAAENAHLYLWTTNRYMVDAHVIAKGWGFKPSQTLTWCKPLNGYGPGGAFANTTEFVLFCRRGSLAYKARVDSTWWTWPRGAHSVKPAAFIDIVEKVSPGPYVELFARAPRLGWDSWGYGFEERTA